MRVPLYAHALYQFELTFDALDSSGANAGAQAQSLQTLMGFWMSCNGQLDTFLYVDPTDNTATSQTIATGDGATKSFLLGRAIGGYYEPVSSVTSIASVTVGGAATTAYTFTAPNTHRLHHGAGERRNHRGDVLLRLPVPLPRRRRRIRKFPVGSVEDRRPQIPSGALK